MTTVDTAGPLGTVERVDGQPVLRFARTLRHPPERIWRALVERDQLACWMPAFLDGELHEGATIKVPFFADVVEKYSIEQPVLEGEIRIWQPPHLLEWRWDTDVLRWELEPVTDGTRLTLTVAIDPGGVPPYMAGAGFHICLAHLERLLDTGSAPPLASDDPTPVEDRYRAAWGES